MLLQISQHFARTNRHHDPLAELESSCQAIHQLGHQFVIPPNRNNDADQTGVRGVQGFAGVQGEGAGSQEPEFSSQEVLGRAENSG
jgi:hypothetical protein